MPAPTGVSQQAQLGTASGASTTATFTSNPPASHQLLVAFFHDTSTVPTVSGCGATWTRYAAVGQQGGNMDFFIGVNPSGSAKVVTVTCGGAGRIVGIALDVTGIDPANPFDRGAYASGSGNGSNPQAVIPLYPNAGVFAFGWAAQLLADIAGGTAGGFTALTGKQQTGGAGTMSVVGSYRLSTPPTGTSLGTLQVATAAGQSTNVALPTKTIQGRTANYQVPAGVSSGDSIIIGSGAHAEIVVITFPRLGYADGDGNQINPPVVTVAPALQYAHAAGETVAVPITYGTSWSGNGVSRLFGGMAVSLRGAPLAALTLSMTMAGTSAMTPALPIWVPPATDLLEFVLLDGSTMAQLAILANATQGSWADLFNDTGSGTFLLPAADPKAALLKATHAISCRLNGLERFRYWLDDLKKAVATPQGQAGEFWTCAGRGFEAYLERGALYPVDGFGFNKTNTATLTGFAGAILAPLVRSMQARGGLSALTWDFSETYDSSGTPWATPLTTSVNVGADLLSIVKQLRALGVAIRLRRDFTLQAWEVANAGRHLEGSVVLREGYHFSGPLPYGQPSSQLRTRLVVEGDLGTIVEVTHPTLTVPLEALYGRREGYLRVNGVADVPGLTAAGQTAIANSQSATESITVPITHGTGIDVYDSFEPADWIAIDALGTWDRVPYRAAGATVVQADAGGYTTGVTLSSLPASPFLDLQAKVAALR